jgi:hypothetical protein
MGNISQFIGGFNGGTRVNRFNIVGNIGAKVNSTLTAFTEFHIRAASMPEAVLGNIAVNWHGRTVNYPGDRAYKPWNITILDDHAKDKTSLYKAFHDWHQTINNHDTNKHLNLNSPKDNFSNAWTVSQLDADGVGIIKSFTLNNCWPVGVGPLELDMGKDNTIGAFQVTILFTHYTLTTIGTNYPPLADPNPPKS